MRLRFLIIIYWCSCLSSGVTCHRLGGKFFFPPVHDIGERYTMWWSLVSLALRTTRSTSSYTTPPPGTRAGGGSVESETHIYPHMCMYIVYILEQSLKLHVLLKWQYSHNAQCTCYPGYGLDEPVLGPPAAGSNAHLV